VAAVRNVVMENVRYPPAAIKAAQSGTAVVRLQVARDGTILDFKMVQTTGYPALDAEARDVFLRIVKVPAMPNDLVPEAKTIHFTVPLNFKLI